MKLTGQAVLVTGGSRGLGAALGVELARRGARVVLVARGAAPVEAVVQRIRDDGGEAHALVDDLGDAEAAFRIAGAAAALVGPLDVVVHNASALGPTPLRALADLEPEDFARVIDVNLGGPFRLTRAVIGGMLLRGRGAVVFVSSDAAVEAYPNWGAYGTSKAGLDHLARIWAAEVEGSGVRIVSVDPGEMDTRMHAEAIPDADPATLTDPVVVAGRLTALLQAIETVRSGARLDLARWHQAAA